MKYILLFLIIISGLFAYNYHGCTLAPDNLHGWVVCLDTILIRHTTDGGTTWQPQQNLPDTVYRFFDVTCIDQYRAWTCGILGQILHTENGGLDWYMQIIGLSKYATRIEFIDQDYGWAACGDGTVALTTNGGYYWDYFGIPPYNMEFYGVSFVNQWDGWMVAGYPDSMLNGQGWIFRSTDGGLNWDSLYRSSAYEDFFDVHFFNQLDGIVVGGDENDYSPIIIKTTDGGFTWNPISTPGNSYYLRAIDFVGNEGWAVGRFGTIIHTTNSGNSWAFQTSIATNTLFDVDFSDNLHGIACGQGIILYTTDGGQSWIQTGIEEQQNTEVETTNLSVYPNPAREITNIRFGIGHSAKSIELKIYDVSGRLVRSFNLASDFLSLASTISWDGTDDSGYRVTQGIYFVKLETPEQTKTEKIILMK
ncbi:T9SS type A sorting domain-containing protein [candidate division WOR-3 bacterium]|nr:T9SS type A sorting domain-containing protein [candidate division WOR-3 bacterium]